MGTVLVIDDDAHVRLLCRRVLESAGYEVIEASNGAAGVELFFERPADAVLCDIYMPEMDGIETIRHLTSEFIGVRIVAMSSSFATGYGLSTLARKLGAVDAIAKPFTRGRLLDAVRCAVEDLGAEDPAPTPS
jgi:CheY-like chemotaxis protein